MKNNLKYFTFLFVTIICLSVFNVYASEDEIGEWKEVNGEKYYYVDGKPVSGWKTIDGENYFFGITTHKLLHGWQNWNGLFYLDKDGKTKEGWNIIDGEKYYVKDKYMVNHWQEIDGENYFFGCSTYKLLHGWQNWNGMFYLDKDGKTKEGWNIIDGEKYYVKDKYMVNHWQEIDGENYFFGCSTYKLLHGFQNWNGMFYLDEEGKTNEGWNIIDGEKYYVKDKYLVKEWQQIDGKNYFFGCTTYKLLHGFQNFNGMFYLDEEGKTNEGWNIIDGEKYYVKDKYLVREWQQIDGENYFFGGTTYKLLHGFQNSYGMFYLDADGKTKEGWNTINGEQYYVRNKYLQNGFQTIDGKVYFFGMTTYKRLYGFQNYQGKFYAQPTTGEIVPGWNKVGNDLYYIRDNHLLIGFKQVDGKNYYFNTSGVWINKSCNVGTRIYTVNDNTQEIIKVQYVPYYYNQKDSRWANRVYGTKKFGSTGCSPTSMAMAFTSLKEQTILPTDVADYLYYNTDQFNKRLSGTSGMGIIYAANYYNVKLTPIYSKDQLIQELSNGKIVYAAMGNGKFATTKWNHAILIYDYKNDYARTLASDPLNTGNNGLVEIDRIWNEKSKDPDDLSGGSALYALSEY